MAGFLFIRFPLFKNYDLSHLNIKELIILSDLLSFLKVHCKSYNKNNGDIDFIFHKIGLILISQGKIKGVDVIHFIQNDEFYMNTAYNKYLRSLDVLNSIDVNSIDEKFLVEWLKMDWYGVFKSQYEYFIHKVCSFITNIKDFGKLFILFNIRNNNNNNNNNNSNIKYCLKAMQERFCQLYNNTYNLEEYPQFINLVIDLIFYSDNYKADISDFLKRRVQKILNVGLVKVIYTNLFDKYKEISNDSRETILDFLLQISENSGSSSLLHLIKSYPTIIDKIFCKMEKFIIKPKEILEIEETENFKLFKELMISGYFFTKELLETIYIKESNIVITGLHENIEKGEILFTVINEFYYENKADLLYDRLKVICRNDENEAKILKLKLDEEITTIKEALKNLQLILDDFILFFYYTHKEDRAILNEIIEKIKTGKINCFSSKLSNDYKKYSDKYKSIAEKRATNNKSVFFKVIFKLTKQKYKYDEEIKCITETENLFKKINIIFLNGDLNNLSKDLLKICIISIKNRKKEEIIREIDILIDIFNINKSKINKENLVENLILFSKKEKICNDFSAIKVFIEQIGAIKTDLIDIIDIIIKKLQESSQEKEIKEIIESLKQYDIIPDQQNNNENNNYLNILIKLKERPESILFLFKINIEDCKNLQDLLI